MKVIKIKVDEIPRKLPHKYFSITWRSPTGCIFQDMFLYDSWKWADMTPDAIYNVYKSNPNQKVRLSLIANTRRFYSTCKIKNVWLEVEVD